MDLVLSFLGFNGGSYLTGQAQTGRTYELKNPSQKHERNGWGFSCFSDFVLSWWVFRFSTLDTLASGL